jgi:hypothetical protein
MKNMALAHKNSLTPSLCFILKCLYIPSQECKRSCINLYPELSVRTLSSISVNVYMPRILAKFRLLKGSFHHVEDYAMTLDCAF